MPWSILSQHCVSLFELTFIFNTYIRTKPNDKFLTPNITLSLFMYIPKQRPHLNPCSDPNHNNNYKYRPYTDLFVSLDLTLIYSYLQLHTKPTTNHNLNPNP